MKTTSVLLLVAISSTAYATETTTVLKPVNQFGQVQHQQGGYVVKQQSDGSTTIKPVNQYGQVQHHKGGLKQTSK